jgi:putative membrane protein
VVGNNGEIMKRYQFTEEEKKEIEEAVKSLETRSCGEVVPYFVRSSQSYPEVAWRLSALMGFSSAALLCLLGYFWLLPSEIHLLEGFILVIILMIVGYALPVIFPSFVRLLVSKENMNWHVRSRAMNAFLEENLHHTEERVGVLIFISRLEHRVIVLGDSGINAKVEEQEWKEVVDEVTAGIKRNEIGDGLVKAIAKCEILLISKGFVRKDTDTNELPDGLRIGQ